jgi:hypothetical protein
MLLRNTCKAYHSGAKNKVAVDLHSKEHGEINGSQPAKNKVAMEPSPSANAVEIKY